MGALHPSTILILTMEVMTISDKTIYDALRRGGLSPAGACGMMGNMNAESALISTNVEDRCTMGDFDYTNAVDTGSISQSSFVHDSFGYGLCQWTYYTRKQNLYNATVAKGISVGDETTQCGFCIWELQNYYVGLYRDLCTTQDIADAAKRICAEYEQPAVNNFAVRINSAQQFYNKFANDDVDTGCGEDSCPIEYSEPEEETCSVNVRILHKGCLGRDVFLLQAGLFDAGYDCGIPDGDFGVNTEEAVKQLQKANSVEATGIADWFVWQTVLQPR